MSGSPLKQSIDYLLNNVKIVSIGKRMSRPTQMWWLSMRIKKSAPVRIMFIAEQAHVSIGLCIIDGETAKCGGTTAR